MKAALTFLLVLYGHLCSSQVVTGIVFDHETNEPIEFCNIVILPEGTRGTFSDSTGYFSLNLNEGQNLMFAHLVYLTSTIGNLPANNDTVFLDTIPMFLRYEPIDESIERELRRQKKNFPICGEPKHRQYRVEDFQLKCRHGIVNYPWKWTSDHFGLSLNYSEIKNCIQHLL